MKYKHTNIIASDWQALARFYEEVFACVRVPPERHLSGAWLEQGTGVKGASFSGVHLRLPGYGDAGPTLEIYRYVRNEPKSPPAANREGFGHIAFEVGEVEATLREVLAHGGRAVGKVVSQDVEGVGRLTFVYAADPEGNILELQSWASGFHEDCLGVLAGRREGIIGKTRN
jgi:predicted enzyme related to lactoylglutathione lyase